jgi:Tfp pilus assembly protein PilF
MIFRDLLPAILILVPFLSTAGFGQTATGPAGTNAPADAVAKAEADPATPFIERALSSLKQQDIQGAAVLLSQGLVQNPHSIPAHILLGSLYASKRLFPQAEEQFTLAEKDAPTDLTIQFYLADIKLAAGDYGQARAIYVPLEKTPGKEDYVAYKVFLCDMLANQEGAATAELAAFKQSPVQPSYYFANAAWCVTQHDSATAKRFLDKAATTFPMPQNEPYAQALRTLGFLPLPAN